MKLVTKNQLRITIYDPPSGWKYGFPRQYLPKLDETVEQTLIRDGYPKHMAETVGKWTRFWDIPEDEKGDTQ